MKDPFPVSFVRNLRIGWNLGNTMDATGYPGFSPVDPQEYETCWGNPETTLEMIQTVAAAGFRVLRLPVTWGQKMGPSPGFPVAGAWMGRVQQIVDWGLQCGLHVILNVHHDNEWIMQAPDHEGALSRFAALWQQIADRFADYDTRLVFEGLNEPRGQENEWTGGTPESRGLVNRLNQKFVDIIRTAGGRNPNRWLMVPPHAASGKPEAIQDFVMPTDRRYEDPRIIVSIHSYPCFDFSMNTGPGGRSDWGSPEDQAKLEAEFQGFQDSFVARGIPVIIGEMGAISRGNDKARQTWARACIREARKRGMICIWWDNNWFAGSGERFGLLDRKNLKWEFPQVLQGLMEGLED